VTETKTKKSVSECRSHRPEPPRIETRHYFNAFVVTQTFN